VPVLRLRFERAVFAFARVSFATLGTTTRAKVLPPTFPAASRAATWKERLSLCENAPMSAESCEPGTVCATAPFA
jgi:hypothetical protein